MLPAVMLFFGSHLFAYIDPGGISLASPWEDFSFSSETMQNVNIL
jgi:hypothetical protein